MWEEEVYPGLHPNGLFSLLNDNLGLSAAALLGSFPYIFNIVSS